MYFISEEYFSGMKCANFKRLMARPPPIENINNINPVWLSNDHHNPGVQMIHLHVIRSTQKVFRTGKLLLLQKTIQLVQAGASPRRLSTIGRRFQ